MKRITSESKLPGMKATRDWESPDNLSAQAKTAGAAKRREREELARMDREIEGLEGLLRTIDRGRRRLK